MAVSAQSNSSSQDTAGSSLCNSSISSANASGIYSFPVEIARADQDSYTNERVPDPSWAITVTGGNGESIERRYWYSTAGQDYADDIDINYDVCALIWSRLPINTIRLGQSDSGNCSTVFSERCIDGLTSKASSSALQWATYSSAPPFENLTAGVLPSICGYIFRDLLETMAENCTNEFGGTELNPMGYTSINAEGKQVLHSSGVGGHPCKDRLIYSYYSPDWIQLVRSVPKRVHSGRGKRYVPFGESAHRLWRRRLGIWHGRRL